MTSRSGFGHSYRRTPDRILDKTQWTELQWLVPGGTGWKFRKKTLDKGEREAPFCTWVLWALYMSGAHTTCHLEVQLIVIGGTSRRTHADDCRFKVPIKHLVVGFLNTIFRMNCIWTFFRSFNWPYHWCHACSYATGLVAMSGFLLASLTSRWWTNEPLLNFACLNIVSHHCCWLLLVSIPHCQPLPTTSWHYRNHQCIIMYSSTMKHQPISTYPSIRHQLTITQPWLNHHFTIK